MAVTHGTFTGSVPITLTVTGLPAGVTFTDDGGGSYTLTGSWPAAGTYNYTVTATNAFGSISVPLNRLITTAVVVAPVAPVLADVTGTAGAALAYTSLAWTGTAPIVLTQTGLPAGVTFTDNGNGTFTLGGVFPATGSVNLVVTGTNASGNAADTMAIISTVAAGSPVLNPGDMPWINIYADLDLVVETALVGGGPFTSVTAIRTGGELVFPAWLIISARPDGLGIRANGNPPPSYVGKRIEFAVQVCNAAGCITIGGNSIEIT